MFNTSLRAGLILLGDINSMVFEKTYILTFSHFLIVNNLFKEAIPYLVIPNNLG